ncbi:MAG: DUF4920 domain-containing protein [Cellvibrionaceae bacterium]
MKAAVTLFVLSLFSLTCFAEHYGAELSEAEPISVTEAIALVDANKQTTALVQGEVTSVCQAKGCWMGFSSEAGDVRVTFKDYGFFVPFSIVGKTVLAEGTVEKVQWSLKDSKHLTEDAGGDPDAVTEPIVEYQMVASGVKVKS